MFSRSHFDRTIFIVTAFLLPHSCRRRNLADAANPQLCSRRRLLHAAAFSWPPHSRNRRFHSIIFSLPYSHGKRYRAVAFSPEPHSRGRRVLAATFSRSHSRLHRTRAVDTYSASHSHHPILGITALPRPGFCRRRVSTFLFSPPDLCHRHTLPAAAYSPLHSPLRRALAVAANPRLWSRGRFFAAATL